MTTPAKTPRGRWFRFSLRTGFVLLTLLGVLLGWLAVQLKWIRDRHEAIREMTNYGELLVQSKHAVRTPDFPGNPAPWSIGLLGEPPVWFFDLSVSKCGGESQADALEQRLRPLFPEAEIRRSK